MRKLASMAFILLFSSSSLQAGGGGNPGMEKDDDIYNHFHGIIMTLKQEMYDRSSLIEQNQENTNRILNQQRGQIENLENANQQRIANETRSRDETDIWRTQNTRQTQETNTRITELERRLTTPANRWKARFRNGNEDWAPYINANWTPVTFTVFKRDSNERFEGEDILQRNLSTIEIPEDGEYSLLTHYYWRSNSKGATAPYTGIAINTPTNMNGCYKQHHLLLPHCVDSGSLNRTTYLHKGEKVMVSIFGQPNAEYYLGGFSFEIEKLR